MSFEDVDSKEIYSCDGIVDDFQFNHLTYDKDDLDVYLYDTDTPAVEPTLLTRTTNYTVTLADDFSSATVTTNTVYANNYEIIVDRKLDQTQDETYSNYNRFPAPVVEKGLNRLTQMIQKLQEEVDRSLKFDVQINSDTIDATVKLALLSGYVPAINSTADGIEWVALADIGDYSFPAGTGFVVQTASLTAAIREITVGLGLSVTNGNAVSDNPLIELPFTPREQSTPDDTVYVLGGNLVNPSDETGSNITVANNAASSVTFPVVTADSRIDLLVVNSSGTFSRVAGSQSASPTPPAYPTDKMVVAEITVDETSSVIINTADIRPVMPIYVGGNLRANTLASTSNGKGASLIGLEDSAGDVTATDVEGAIAELAAGNPVKTATGSFTSDGTNNRTISTGITGTLLAIFVNNQGQNAFVNWHAGDSGNHIRGAGTLIVAANATTTFTISGSDFIVGASSVNGGATACGWTALYY